MSGTRVTVNQKNEWWVFEQSGRRTRKWRQPRDAQNLSPLEHNELR